MPLKNADFLRHFLAQTISPHDQITTSAEKLDEYILQVRIWAIQEPDAFEQGVAKTIESFFSPESDTVAIDLMERYSLLQIAWITQEAVCRLESCDML
jgi:hypothetical protein